MTRTNLQLGVFCSVHHITINGVSNIGLFAQPLHSLHIVLHGSKVGDLCGAARRKPAFYSISHSLPVAPGWGDKAV